MISASIISLLGSSCLEAVPAVGLAEVVEAFGFSRTNVNERRGRVAARCLCGAFPDVVLEFCAALIVD